MTARDAVEFVPVIPWNTQNYEPGAQIKHPPQARVAYAGYPLVRVIPQAESAG